MRSLPELYCPAAGRPSAASCSWWMAQSATLALGMRFLSEGLLQLVHDAPYRRLARCSRLTRRPRATPAAATEPL